MEENKFLEGQKDNDSLDTTSVSEPTVEEEGTAEETEETAIPQLNSSPVPTDAADDDATGTEPEPEVEEEPSTEPEPLAEAAPEQPVESEQVVSETVVNEKVEPEQVHEELGVTETPALKFTQSQVDEIAGKTRQETREKTFRYIYDRYGVGSEEELDDLIGNAQRYDSLQEEYDGAKASWKQEAETRGKELNDIKEQLALLQSGIDKGRYEDAKFILRGKGLEVNTENINNELATHPEWKGQNEQDVGSLNKNFAKVGNPNSQFASPNTVSKVSVLGNENSVPNSDVSEEERVLSRMFKV